MPTKTYHKLVRDRIPEIIEADGKTCVCETLSDEDYISLLDQKLNEELAEYQESKSLEELADLLEVMQAVVKARGWTLEELAITLNVGKVFMDVTHEYPDLTVHLTLFHATIREGTPRKLEHNDIRWITVDEIDQYEFCPADVEILRRLKDAY